ncbi:serine hydrolase domain-containing protein [Solilutibacter silvestris]|uniref:Beta-lactamase class C and other penicillin binding protein n=1 Tax=Solilutibacter silvestris TaxID=1645665 RepID=A0A2K1PX67_9GAMM|nr:serine hydrolase domain-containing protein [Lysobacter silvestris]PNS07392.1 Beta-lactamase class C and other penicillin binding protein [Lysobacter silvestris]
MTMLGRTLPLLFLAGCAATGGGSAPSGSKLSQPQAAAVDTAVAEGMRRDGTVGMAIGVIENDRIVYLKGYGDADREAHVPVTTRTMFRWASVSKPVAAIAAMQLVEQGKLDLDADVRGYVPEFPDKGVKITTRQLLGHQGGIVHYDNGPVVPTVKTYAQAHPFADVVVALDAFKDSPLVNAPGTKFNYTTHGFMLVAAVVQRAGGEPFAQQVRERIIEPLHLTTMQPDYQWIAIPDRATGYVKQDGAVARSTDTDVSWKLGGGGYISDIGDFAGFAKGVLDGRLVSAATQTAMWTPQKTADGKATGYGLGFDVSNEGGRLRIAHSGSQEKTRTWLAIWPQEKRGIVIMTNSEWVDPKKYATPVLEAIEALDATHAAR